RSNVFSGPGATVSKKSAGDGFELESQFILRVPIPAAGDLREAVRQGNSNLKERLAISLESTNRTGLVRFDAWHLPSRVYDLPCVIESHKTLDRKTFYKTADVSQIMICYEPGEEPKSEDEAPMRKRKDALAKKYLYPHGVTPPLKNVRKRRFRKTLKKKYIDFPEIEKEVKRLFREAGDTFLGYTYADTHGWTDNYKKQFKAREHGTLFSLARGIHIDNEAESVRYEVIRADDEMKTDISGAIQVTNHPGRDHSAGLANIFAVCFTTVCTLGPSGLEGEGRGGDGMLDVGEHDLFGEPLSSSDEDNDNPVLDKDPDGDADGDGDDDGDELADAEGLLNVNVDSTDDSRSPSKKKSSLLNGAGTSARAHKSSLLQGGGGDDNDDNAKDFVTEFSQGECNWQGKGLIDGEHMGGEESNMSMADPSTSERGYEEEAEAARALETDFAKEDDVSQNTGLLERLSELEREIARLADLRRAQEEEIAGIENMALRQRFQSVLQNTKLEQAEKQREYDNIVQLLHQD
ncbi:transcription initiation factor TFIID subunit 7-like, partial [Tropilaelaps mercedesae]